MDCDVLTHGEACRVPRCTQAGEYIGNPIFGARPELQDGCEHVGRYAFHHSSLTACIFGTELLGQRSRVLRLRSLPFGALHLACTLGVPVMTRRQPMCERRRR